MVAITLGKNVAALGAMRQLDRATDSISRTYEALSTGLRINRAVDDAAGISVASKLEVDSRVSKIALNNINDSISMLSIVDAALSSQGDILQRMVELAEQSANGVYSNEQRQVLQKEYSALLSEFDRVADSTTFNGINLLRNRENAQIALQVGIDGQAASHLIMQAANSHTFNGVYGIRSDYNGDGVFDFGDLSFLSDGLLPEDQRSTEFSDLANSLIPQYLITQVTDSEGNERIVRLNMSRIFEDITTGSPEDALNAIEFYWTGQIEGTNTYNGGGEFPGIAFPFNNSMVNLNMTFGAATANLSIDFSGAEFQRFWPNQEVRETLIGFTNIERSYTARNALTTVRNRIEDLSLLRGEFGTLQSRLTAGSAYLSQARAEFQNASSRIKDADIAAEAASLIKNQIMQRAASAILAQANQAPELALRLLN